MGLYGLQPANNLPLKSFVSQWQPNGPVASEKLKPMVAQNSSSSLSGIGDLGHSFSSLSAPNQTASTCTLNTIQTKHMAFKSVEDGTSEIGKQNFDEDENKERGNWSGKLDFFLSLLGYAVGLGNVWRFPYLCYRNGGGAFLVPYFIMLTFVGMPLFFLELSLGQFCSNGPLTCWSYAPIFQGIGVAQLIVSALVAIYYNMIIAWSLHYMIASFTALPGLPWDNCYNKWNTIDCFDRLPDVACDEETGLEQAEDGRCYNGSAFVGLWDYDTFQKATGRRRIPASEEYYRNRMLGISTGIEDMGPPKWDLVLSLLLAWIIAFLCMIKGIKSSGKVVYFTALFPYAVLIILLIRGATLKNAAQGIYFYMVPKWEKLGNAKVWNDAAVQIFFSLSNCWGGSIALASYNRFHSPCLRDSVSVALINSGTSVFAGFVIFSFLGFIAGEINSPVSEVVDSGPGLAFIVYPDAVTRMPASPLWAIVFFAMLITLGLDSQFAMLETILTSIMDKFPELRPHKTKVVATMCVILFLLGLTLTTKGGAYMLQLMDTYCAGWAILLLGLMECVSLAWIYGVNRFFSDIEIMIGSRPRLWWRFCWQFASPLLIVFVVLFSWIDYTSASYGAYKYPQWADAMGWLMTLCSIIWVPIIAAYLVCRRDEPTVKERFLALLKPTREWGPALIKHRQLVTYVDGFVVDPWTIESSAITVPTAADNPAFTPTTPRASKSKSPFYIYSPGGQSVHSLASVGGQSAYSYESAL